MSTLGTILVVDDDESLRSVIEYSLRERGHTVVAVGSGTEALQRVPEGFDLVITDVLIGDISGMDVLAETKARSPQTAVMVITAYGAIEDAVRAMKLGALDYLTKPFDLEALGLVVEKALRYRALAEENIRLRSELADRFSFENIIGVSPKMQAVFATLRTVASSDATVVITGETGTGKELVARALHHSSARRDGPFVAVNCAAIPETLLESELFGHVKGAFTGAIQSKRGKFELANGGTLFLDELAELKLDVQAKLLRALQEREIERVGGARPIPVDLRVICATNRNLDKLVADGKFREDLYWRLKVVPIELPSLRNRREDIPDLAQHFLARFAAAYGRPTQTLSEGAVGVLERYDWPGNIRELENLIERLVVICDAPVIDESELPLDLSVGAGLAEEAERESNYAAAMAAFERGYLRRVLAQNGWNRRRAAEQLGIGYSTLKAKLRLHGLAPDGDDD